MPHLELRPRCLMPVPVSEATESWWGTQLQGAMDIFGPFGIEVAATGLVEHMFGDGDGVIHVDACSHTLTIEQAALYASINRRSSNEVSVFIVADLGGWAGCAQYPQNEPGLIIVLDESLPEWVLAHELGHVLGWDIDLGDNTRLMYGSIGWTQNPPRVIDRERDVFLGSPFLTT